MVFDISRNLSSQVAVITNSLTGQPSEAKTRHLAPRIAHSVTLVTGGVIAGMGYEIIGRPFDNARRLLYLDNIRARSSPHPRPTCPPKAVIFNAIRDHGTISFFQTRDLPNADRTGTSLHRTLRTLARVGPWGVGFLLWNLWDESIIEDV